MLRFKWYFTILEKKAQGGQTLIMINIIMSTYV